MVCHRCGISLYDGDRLYQLTANDGLIDNDIVGLFEDNEGKDMGSGFQQQPCFYLRKNLQRFKFLRNLEK
jgi:hypothetical protein